MTNINCTKNCLYQEDGKCCYDRVETHHTSQNIITDKDCLYFRLQNINKAK